MIKKIVSIVGIRPDFIRMSEIFKKLDANFEHIIVNTGQHYDKMLCDVFFDELNIRKPDYNLQIGGPGKKHYHHLAEMAVKSSELMSEINPDMILFLGDSNSVLVAPVLRKEGFKIGHIEAGMRSFDKRMLEETNRIVCDHCSDKLFVYTEEYKANCLKEGISENSVYVVGNTIVEVLNQFKEDIFKNPKKLDTILLDIHRPENFKYEYRLRNIISYALQCKSRYNKNIKMLKFPRTMEYIKEFNIDLSGIELVELMSYRKFLQEQYDSFFCISDSGTAQEEPALLDTRVIVPRDYTERPQSMKYKCSFMINVGLFPVIGRSWESSWKFIEEKEKMDVSWLGDGRTSDNIVESINSEFYKRK